MADILLVDDDPVFLRLMQHALRDEGHRLRTVQDGASALAEVRRERPDLIVLDVEMPELDGYRVLNRIKTSPDLADLLVVLMTARDSPGDVTLGLDIGADFYLTKPFRPVEFTALVRRALAIRAKES